MIEYIILGSFILWEVGQSIELEVERLLVFTLRYSVSIIFIFIHTVLPFVLFKKKKSSTFTCH